MKVIIDGKVVYPAKDKGGARAERGPNDDKVRAQLLKKYPGVTFLGNCNKIRIGENVTMDRDIRVIQTGEDEIEILGSAKIGSNVTIATGDDGAEREGVSVSGGRGNVIVVGDGIVAGNIVGSSVVMGRGRGVSITSARGSVSISGGTPSKLALNNVIIENGAEIEGTNINLDGTTVKATAKIVVAGSAKIADRNSTINSSITAQGSGDINMDEAEINSPVSVQGSGDVSIDESKVNASVSVMGSGDVKIDKSTVNAAISVMGSGDVKIKKSTVHSPINVRGHQDISLINDRMSSD